MKVEMTGNEGERDWKMCHKGQFTPGVNIRSVSVYIIWIITFDQRDLVIISVLFILMPPAL